MATLTIRKIPDEQIHQLKEVAEKNNRSMESQVRSILEEWLAGTVAHEMTRKTNFYDEIREFMDRIDFEGLKEGELSLPERNPDDSRPPVSFKEY
ncbi:FitA-like ribbon-helix-helix domain-containing protein [Bifidobacterium felsineum]|uniref:DNA-binding protein n=1 Tax=Bifidobacterium felsineum TaxID=2045440 RepID=A0A2M9HIR3_9BIFI|nr:Arc family DNA-binding protein [Bifidobacterium felsineum]MBT1164935.1 Arc family DNA-binding protein [Bifidobacterium felsineum]PJM76667.1 DNA-binding protein [Bifidobacterium felsineum]